LKVGGVKDMFARAKNLRPRPLQVKPRPFVNATATRFSPQKNEQ